MKTNTTTSPRWLSLASAAVYAGVSKRLVEIWERDGHIRAARLITPGNMRGRTLVDRESLDAFIESYVGTPPAAIKMNERRA